MRHPDRSQGSIKEPSSIGLTADGLEGTPSETLESSRPEAWGFSSVQGNPYGVGLGSPPLTGSALILLREENRSDTPIGFGDDPDLRQVWKVIGRQQSVAMGQAQFILF